MEKFAKLLEQKAKGQKPMSGPEKDAKMRAVHEMRKMASDEMAAPLHNLKKVTVASDSPQGIKEGLNKAKELIGHKDSPIMEHAEEAAGTDLDDDMEAGEDPEHAEKVLGHDVDPEDMSPEEIQEKIMELQKLLAVKKMS